MSPCIFSEADGYSTMRNFYHGTAIGRIITNQFWRTLGNDVLTLNAYDSHPETAKLKPWTDAMFCGASFSLLNYEKDIFDLIKTSGLIHIHIAELDHLSPGQVRRRCLRGGTSLGGRFSSLCWRGWRRRGRKCRWLGRLCLGRGGPVRRCGCG